MMSSYVDTELLLTEHEIGNTKGCLTEYDMVSVLYFMK